jgi:hypothetical protein
VKSHTLLTCCTAGELVIRFQPCLPLIIQLWSVLAAFAADGRCTGGLGEAWLDGIGLAKEETEFRCFLSDPQTS